VKRKP